ncbi:hypothetical protein LCGC14_0894250 [marine sediment metagenome]|uniref:6-carboxy-5,6,7,8-tetrahydropterin synthase n=1 Tax=marine sediment metagenome TaxID=412755 RepID=A0A0F9NYB4_9ZZZZ
MIVAKKIGFDAAHYLPDYKGKCNQMHGHHWVVEVAVDGKVDEHTGMVVDFTLLKEFLKTIEETFDHKVVNDVIKNPTAENICFFIMRKFSDQVGGYSVDNPRKQEWREITPAWIKVWETEDSYALLSY